MSLLKVLENTIDFEAKAQNIEYESVMQSKLQERIQKGYTMVNLKVDVEFFEETPRWCSRLSGTFKYVNKIRVRSDMNNSKIREGVQVVLTNTSHGIKLLMEVEYDGVSEFVLRSGDFDVKSNSMDSANYPKDDWELNIRNQNVTHRLLKATWEILNNNKNVAQFFDSFLNGDYENGYSPIEIEPLDNESQNEAVRKSLGSRYFHLIQGPPGTGKTFTIAKIVSLMLEQGKNVLVTGPTHTAINNCLNAISKLVPDNSKIVKLGERYQAEEIRGNANISKCKQLRHYEFERDGKFSKNGIVIGATPYAMCYPASKKLEGWYFDAVVFDEAAQLSIPMALAAMLFAKKLIFVGDHKQLDPIFHKGDEAVGELHFDCSIFRKLTDLYPSDITLLNQSYRLNENLIRVPNALFYDDRLSSARKTEKTFVNFQCTKAQQIVTNESNELLVLHHQFDSLGRSTYEAEITADIVSDLLANGVQIQDIGIISPYRAQIREIKRVLVEKNVISEALVDSVFIDTVERMQGQEMAYIIYSMSNANPREAQDRLEFFYSPNRLNVAITRAYLKTIVIANDHIFECCKEILASDESKEIKSFAGIFLKYRELSTKIDYDVQDEEW